MRPRVARRATPLEVRHRTLRFRPSLKTSLKTNRESVIERARGSQLALSDDERRDDKLAQLVTRSEGGREEETERVFFPATGESVHENFTAPPSPEETSSSARRNPLRFAVAPRISLSTARAYEGGDTKGRGGGGRSLNLYEEGTISRARAHSSGEVARARSAVFSPNDSCESLLSELSPPLLPPLLAPRVITVHKDANDEYVFSQRGYSPLKE